MKAGHYGVLNYTLVDLYPSLEIGFIAEEPCMAGAWCTDGKEVMCPAGTFSRPLATSCTPCGPSGYSLSDGSIDCIPISDGFYGISSGPGSGHNAFSSVKKCPAGSYCVGGVRRACPKGTYQPNEEEHMCLSCGIGYYNPHVGASSRDKCVDISNGFYGIGGDETARHDQALCNVGNYCIGGAREACPPGYYQKFAGRSECDQCSKICPKGEEINQRSICDKLTGASLCIDVQPPRVILNGENPIRLQFGSEFADPGASCSDNRDGMFAATRMSVIPTQLGSHHIRYHCEDAAGNVNETIRNLIIYDAIAPVITLNGPDVVKMIQFDDYIEHGADVTDEADPSVEIGLYQTYKLLKEFFVSIFY